MKCSILIFLLLSLAGNVFADSGFGEVFKEKAKYYDLSKILDYSAIEGFNQEAALLWTKMVHDAGSEQKAYERMYQAPTRDLVQLHENILQTILTSQFNNDLIGAYFREGPSFDYSHVMGTTIHPLLREAASNVRSYLTQRLAEIFTSGRVAGRIFRAPDFEINSALYNCTFYDCSMFPEYKKKFNDDDKAIYRAWVYADIIAGLDLATWKCARYINPESALQDLLYVNSEFDSSKKSSIKFPFAGAGNAPRSLRVVFESTMLVPFCQQKRPMKVLGTPAESGSLYLKGTQVLN